jgi:hypothetical protein
LRFVYPKTVPRYANVQGPKEVQIGWMVPVMPHVQHEQMTSIPSTQTMFWIQKAAE